ncbi:MAG TPA: hydroxyacid dehydrogenase [Opitutaceae bacterium]
MINVAFILGSLAFAEIYGEESLYAVAADGRVLAAPCTPTKLRLAPPPWLRDVEVLFSGWDGPRLDAEMLARMPRLRAVLYGAGSIRTIATDACWDRDIVFSSAAALNALPVVEFTLGAILLSFKRVWHHARHVREQRAYDPLRPLPASTGAGATIGLFSLGLIGRGVAERLRALDVTVLAHDPTLPPETFAEIGARPVTLEALFARSDIVSLHTPLLESTRGIVDRRLLDRMKPNATFINTARGGILRQDDLIDFLAARPDVQAILDVTEPEPPPRESQLYDLPNVALTPHIAGSVGPECRRLGRAMVGEFHRYARGEPLRYAVTRQQHACMA